MGGAGAPFPNAPAGGQRQLPYLNLVLCPPDSQSMPASVTVNIRIRPDRAVRLQMLKAMPQTANATNNESHSVSTVHFPTARGPCNVTTHIRYMIPNIPDASGTRRSVKKLKAASKKPAITR